MESTHNEAFTMSNYNETGAIRLNEDGSGFLFYPSGKVAACVSAINDHQKSFLFYDKSRSGSLLCSINQDVVGFAYSVVVPEPPAREVNEPTDLEIQLPLARIIMSKSGVQLVNNRGTIVRETTWRERQSASVANAIELQLNRHLSIKLINKEKIYVQFQCQSISHEFDCGIKQKRTESYLSKAVRDPFIKGKFHCTISTPSLLERERTHSESMLSKKMLVKPSSTDISHVDISNVMKGLETHFEEYIEKKSVEALTQPLPTRALREDALNLTLKEIPRLKSTGTEIGKLPGFTSLSRTQLSRTAPAILAQQKNSKRVSVFNSLMPEDDVEDPYALVRRRFKKQNPTELDIRRQLVKEHPVMERSKALIAASGRYSIDVPIKHKGTTLIKLERLSILQVDQFVQEAPPNQLIVFCCLTDWHPGCRHVEQLLETVNGIILSGKFSNQVISNEQSPDSLPFRMLKLDMSECSLLTERYNLYHLPACLMFYSGQLVFADVLSGRAVKVEPSEPKPRTLVIEPNFSDQIKTEKVLRRQGLTWDLCMNSDQAIQHIRRLSTTGESYGLMLLGSEVPTPQIDLIVSNIRRMVNSDILLSVMLCSSGSEIDTQLHNGLDFAIRKPLSSASLERIINAWTSKQPEMKNPAHVGMTKEDFIDMMHGAIESGKQGRFLGPNFKFEGGVPCDAKSNGIMITNENGVSTLAPIVGRMRIRGQRRAGSRNTLS